MLRLLPDVLRRGPALQLLNLGQNLLEGGAFNYVSASDSEFDAHMKTWWKSIRRTAAKLKVMRHLPENWKQMRIG